MFLNRRRTRSLGKAGFIFVLSVMLLGSVSASAQNMNILKSTGLAAVIGAGANAGLREGDMLAVKRLINGVWREVTYVQVTNVRPEISRIEVVEIAPQVNLVAGDRVEPMDAQSSIPQSTVSQPQNQPVRRTTQAAAQPLNAVYVGPLIGALVPLGDMADAMETGILYGGAFGFRFRRGMDVTTRFFYALKKDEWALWSFQMVGRRLTTMGLILEVGYDLMSAQELGDADGRFFLGFVGGLGYFFKASVYFAGEVGLTYHIYPSVEGGTGQFLTIQARLIL